MNNPTDEDRRIIFVYSKLHQKIIYSVNVKTKNKKKEYDWIRKYYGDKNLIQPPLTPCDIRKYL